MPAAGGHLGDETILDILEGRAEPGARERMEAHAANCAECRKLLSALARCVDSDADTYIANAPTVVAPERIGRYVLSHSIGTGGMGLVFAAHDPELDRTVAVKVLRADAIDTSSRLELEERLRREARAMAKLSHPNVVAVYDVGTDQERVFIAMELIEGVTLATWLDAPHSIASILETFRAAGLGLAAAHARGVVHRDFKPGNVLVGSDGRVCVTDFGVAKLRATTIVSPDTPRLTITNAAMGTPYYMAPEQFLGERVDARADQFSFCVALYAAVFGVRPFPGNTFEELAAAVIASQITPPPDPGRVPARIHAALIRGMATNPEGRFPSMAALLDALVLEPPRRRRRIALWAGASGAAVVAAAAAIWVANSAGQAAGAGGPAQGDAGVVVTMPSSPAPPPEPLARDAGVPDARTRPPHTAGSPHTHSKTGKGLQVPDTDRGD